MALNAVYGAVQRAGRALMPAGMRIVEGLLVGGVGKIGDIVLRIKEAYDALVPKLKKYSKIVVQAIVFAVGYGISRRFNIPEAVIDAMVYSLGVDVVDVMFDEFALDRKLFVYYDKSDEKLKIEGGSAPYMICLGGTCKQVNAGELVKDQDITVENGHTMVIAVDKDGKWDVEYIPYKIQFKTT